ncbi:MAG: SDR family oxidoreductase [Lachnospiraceae bacterium]|nr:SDR family oxidoreductase [Lachnospiraceae bacterium]
MLKELGFNGKTVLVTGGATGLGLAIAQELDELGARVVIAGRRESLLKEVAEEHGWEYKRLDLADHDSLEGWCREFCEEFGVPYGLVNNAGIQNNKPALSYTKEEIEQILSIVVTGTYLLTKNLAAAMLEKEAGSIVFITSSAVHMALTNNLPYSTAKGGLSSMTRAFASELSPKGIRVNSVAPGWIETELVKESMRRVPERRAQVLHRSLLGRFGQPGDVGRAVAFLLSDAADGITGAELRVDGGIGVSL